MEQEKEKDISEFEEEFKTLLTKYINEETQNEEMTLSQEHDYFKLLNDCEEFIKLINKPKEEEE